MSQPLSLSSGGHDAPAMLAASVTSTVPMLPTIVPCRRIATTAGEPPRAKASAFSPIYYHLCLRPAFVLHSTPCRKAVPCLSFGVAALFHTAGATMLLGCLLPLSDRQQPALNQLRPHSASRSHPTAGCGWPKQAIASYSRL